MAPTSRVKHHLLTPARPPGFADIVTKDDIVDLLIARGYCCEDQRIDFSDCKEMLGWAPSATRFKLTLINPRLLTDCVMGAKRFKRWPCVFGFGEGPCREDAPFTIVDGLHRCAVANGRGYAGVWAYIPVQDDGVTLHNWDTFTAFEALESAKSWR